LAGAEGIEPSTYGFGDRRCEVLVIAGIAGVFAVLHSVLYLVCTLCGISDNTQ